MRLVVILLIFSSILTSCSFKSSEAEQNNSSTITQGRDPLTSTGEAKIDSDGDNVLDHIELGFGRNPYIADLPIVDVKFLQNFKISAKLIGAKESKFVIDTKISSSDPDFKYQVGKIFARENSYNSAAGVGMFSSHHYAEITDHDLTWIKYPDIDPAFYHHELLKNKKYFNDSSVAIDSITIDLENSLKLRANGLFKQISNLKLNFYYFNYDSDRYELLGEAKINRHFFAGVKETFTVKLENVPVDLLKNNFFKKGEFIISEIADYDIPELQLTYKRLLQQVKTKSVPLVVNTPLETSIYYIGLSGNKENFSTVLSHLFPKQIEIQEDQITKIGQFSNNLPDYTYLKELRKLDKKGKWFLLTNQLDRGYLDYLYSPSDYLILSYITGSELASQKSEKVFSVRESISGEEDYRDYPLGNIGPNSRVSIQIKPERSWGTKMNREVEILDDHGGSCGRNCIGRAIYCRWEINVAKGYDRELIFNKDLSGDLTKVDLIVNDDVFPLKDLVDEKLLSVIWKGENLHLTIDDISKIKDIGNFDENLLSLRVYTKNSFDFWGIKLVAADRLWQGMGGCGFLTPVMADKHHTQYLSTDSIHFNEIQITYDRVLNDAGRARFKLKDSANYFEKISISVSSTINNFFN